MASFGLIEHSVRPDPRVAALAARNPDDHAAGREFEERYRDLLVRFCRQRGLQHTDAEDVVQIVLMNVARTLPRFVYDASRGRFRDYLFRCTRNAIAKLARRPIGRGTLLSLNDDDLPVDAGADPAETAVWEAEWVAHHFRMAIQRVRGEFDARNVEIFERSVAGASVAELAGAYGVSEQSIYKSRHRIRARMHEMIAEQVREEDRVDDQPGGT